MYVCGVRERERNREREREGGRESTEEPRTIDSSCLVIFHDLLGQAILKYKSQPAAPYGRDLSTKAA